MLVSTIHPYLKSWTVHWNVAGCTMMETYIYIYKDSSILQIWKSHVFQKGRMSKHKSLPFFFIDSTILVSVSISKCLQHKIKDAVSPIYILHKLDKITTRTVNKLMTFRPAQLLTAYLINNSLHKIIWQFHVRLHRYGNHHLLNLKLIKHNRYLKRKNCLGGLDMGKKYVHSLLHAQWSQFVSDHTA